MSEEDVLQLIPRQQRRALVLFAQCLILVGLCLWCDAGLAQRAALSAPASFTASREALDGHTAGHLELLVTKQEMVYASRRATDPGSPITAIVSATQNSGPGTSLLLRSLALHSFIREIIIVGHSRASVSRAAIDVPRAFNGSVRILNLPGDEVAMSSLLACSMAVHDTCYFARWIDAVIRSSYAVFRELGGVKIVGVVSPESFWRSRQFHFTDASIGLDALSASTEGNCFVPRVMTQLFMSRVSSLPLSMAKGAVLAVDQYLGVLANTFHGLMPTTLSLLPQDEISAPGSNAMHRQDILQAALALVEILEQLLTASQQPLIRDTIARRIVRTPCLDDDCVFSTTIVPPIVPFSTSTQELARHRIRSKRGFTIRKEDLLDNANLEQVNARRWCEEESPHLAVERPHLRSMFPSLANKTANDASGCWCPSLAPSSGDFFAVQFLAPISPVSVIHLVSSESLGHIATSDKTLDVQDGGWDIWTMTATSTAWELRSMSRSAIITAFDGNQQLFNISIALAPLARSSASSIAALKFSSRYDQRQPFRMCALYVDGRRV